ncbi:MAG: hypothetical protein LBN26_04125 [Christensenellaceae bacterium]|nr:hypothetical protein [Christensenellaceae bacterium]
MIQVIFGAKGDGKTKKILDKANDSTQTAKGSIVFIADDGQYMFGLKRNIRFIDASSFHIDGPKMFYGFLCGIAAQDFDLEYIYIDGFLKIVHHSLDTLEEMFKDMEAFAKRSGIKIVLSVNGDSVPEYLKSYIQ